VNLACLVIVGAVTLAVLHRHTPHLPARPTSVGGFGQRL
jgi:hypothetical protein